MPPRRCLGVQTLLRECNILSRRTSCSRSLRKVWDSYTGTVLHSFPHNHIVRTVAISPTSSQILTGGQEKKVRIFDLGRPDADPEFLVDNNSLSHDGVVKSVVWVGDHTGVTAGEDGKIK